MEKITTILEVDTPIFNLLLDLKDLSEAETPIDEETEAKLNLRIHELSIDEKRLDELIGAHAIVNKGKKEIETHRFDNLDHLIKALIQCDREKLKAVATRVSIHSQGNEPFLS